MHHKKLLSNSIATKSHTKSQYFPFGCRDDVHIVPTKYQYHKTPSNIPPIGTRHGASLQNYNPDIY